jgi:hypothetical protein
MYKRNIEALSRNHCCRGKTKSITYSECMSAALDIQHAMRMRRINRHQWPARLYYIFLHYLINGAIFVKKLLNIKCVLIFSTTFPEEFLILRRTGRDIIINVNLSSCKVTVFCYIFMKIELPGHFLYILV